MTTEEKRGPKELVQQMEKTRMNMITYKIKQMSLFKTKLQKYRLSPVQGLMKHLANT